MPVTKPRKRKISEAVANLPRIAVLAEEAADALDIHDEDYAKRVGELEANAEAEMVAAIGAIFDVVLAPLEDGSTTKPGSLIAKKYKAGDISWEALEGFMDRLVAVVGEDRPT